MPNAHRKSGLNKEQSIIVGDSTIGVLPRTTDPITDPNYNQVYIKPVGGVPELHIRDTTGNITQLTSQGATYPGPQDIEETLLSDFEGAADWVVIAGAAVRDGTYYTSGQYSWRLTNSTVIQRTLPAAVDMSSHFLKFNVRTDNVWNSLNPLVIRLYSGTTKYFEATMTGGANPFPWQNNRWYVSTIVRSHFTLNGGATLADWSNITMVQIRATSTFAGTNAWFDNMVAVRTYHEGILSITFDDATSDHITGAFRYMSMAGLHGTEFVITSLIGTGGYLGFFDLVTMREAGWEIASHQNKHTVITAMTAKEALTDRVWAKEYLVRSGFWEGARFFAYPFGTPDPEAKKVYTMSKMYAGAVGWGPETIPPAVDWLVRGYEPANLAEAQAYVDACVAYRCWMVLTFHVTPAWFPDFVNYVVASGVTTMTFSEVYDNFRRFFQTNETEKLTEDAFQKSLKITATAVNVGVNGAYGTATDTYSPAGRLKSPKMQITTAGVGGPETVTVRITVTWEDQTTTNVTTAYVGAGGVWAVSDANWVTLWKESNIPRYITVQAMSNQAVTAATVTIDHLIDGA